MNMKKNKIAGAVYGFTIGDAMGATTEFMTEDQIKTTYGKVTDIYGGGWLRLKPGQVTDDTQMTLCVMDAAMKCKSYSNNRTFMELCVRNFIRWYKSNPPDVGGQCTRGIEALMNGRVTRDMQSAGNGSLMRALPCALLGWEEFNILQGKLTHPGAECTTAIVWYQKVIHDALHDVDIWDVPEYLRAFLKEPTGYVKNTMDNAWIWACEPTFENCIIGAVNHGGDADTIAAIAGGISGARFGYDAIPQKWIDKLDPQVKTKLDEFIAFCAKEVEL